MSSTPSGPVAGPPVAGPWTRSVLALDLDPEQGGWTSLRAGAKSWLDAPGHEELVLQGEGGRELVTGSWQASTEAEDRLGRPTGSPAHRLQTAEATLTRTVREHSGAIRVGYRVASGRPWHHDVVLPLPPGVGEGEPTRGRVEVSGWAHAWLLEGEDALGLHWTTEQRADQARLGWREGEPAPGTMAAGVGSAEQPVPPRRDFRWRLVLTAWRR